MTLHVTQFSVPSFKKKHLTGSLGQGTSPARAFPLRVGEEAPQASAAANNQDVVVVVVPFLGYLQVRSAVLPREAVSGLGGQ